MANEFKTMRVAKATYDFDVLGGGVANAVGLGVSVPSGAIVTRVIGSVQDALTSSGSATVAINIGTTEVNAATAYDHADYTAVDVHYSTPVAANGEVNIDIAGAALTAGKYDIFVEYLY
jgi:hypothetical protein